MSRVIRPGYLTSVSGSEIELYSGRIRALDGNKAANGVGRATLQLRPKLNLSFHADFSSADFSDTLSLFQAGNLVRVETDHGSAPAFVTKVTIASEAAGCVVHASFTPNPQRFLFNQYDATRMKRLVFHVINFPEFLSNTDLFSEHKTGGFKRIATAVLDNSEWRAEMQELPHTHALIKELKDNGGFGVTHVVEISRCNESNFTASEAEQVVQRLYLFLSFAKGAWTAPVLSVGYDEHDKVAHQEWGVRISTPWESRNGWFDTNHGESLRTLFPGFWTVLGLEKIGKAVSNSLYWYLRSNRGGDGAGIDSGIILSQAALERLSSAILEENEIAISKHSTAASRLRTALSFLEIPTSIPTNLIRLSELAESAN